MATRGAEPHESKKARADRELRELLEETRIVLPGLQMLVGFLLILPFNARFGDIGALQRSVYVVCLVACATAAALMMSPSARHRLGFRSIDKERLLFVSNRHLIAGLVLVALAIALAVYLASSMVLATPWAVALAGCVALCFALLWFVAPLARER